MGGKSGGGGDAGTQTIKTEPSDIQKPYITSALMMAQRRYNQQSNTATNPRLRETFAPPSMVNETFLSPQNLPPYLQSSPLLMPGSLSTQLPNTMRGNNSLLDMLLKGNGSG
jgi:hypothetical protein